MSVLSLSIAVPTLRTLDINRRCDLRVLTQKNPSEQSLACVSTTAVKIDIYRVVLSYAETVADDSPKRPINRRSTIRCFHSQITISNVDRQQLAIAEPIAACNMNILSKAELSDADDQTAQ